MEGDLIRVSVDAEGVIATCGVQEEDVQPGYRRDQERDEKMEGEKASERSVVHGETPPKPGDEGRPNIGEGGK